MSSLPIIFALFALSPAENASVNRNKNLLIAGSNQINNLGEEFIKDQPFNRRQLNTGCTSDQHTCANGQCVDPPWYQRCDGWNDCDDESDELNCVCKTPDLLAEQGYEEEGESVLTMFEGFDVTLKCATGYTGKAVIEACTTAGDFYTYSGCIAGSTSVTPSLSGLSTRTIAVIVIGSVVIVFLGGAGVAGWKLYGQQTNNRKAKRQGRRNIAKNRKAKRQGQRNIATKIKARR